MDPAGFERLQQNVAVVRANIAAACERASRSADSVHLIAVTKSVSVEIIRGLYDLGLRDFGESRPQFIWDRKPQLPDDVRWHLIGPLQTNKARRTLPMIHLLHSLDRWSLADWLADEAIKTDVKCSATIEVHLTDEPAKSGFDSDDLRQNYSRLLANPGIDLVGMMAMARYDDNAETCRATFRELRELRDQLRQAHPTGPKLEVLSMGMSNDYQVAIEEGATHVRVGTALFEGIPSYGTPL